MLELYSEGVKKMKKKVVIIITLTVVIGVVGCATLPMGSHLEKPVSMTQISDTAKVSENKFVIEKRCFWVVGGIAPLSVPEVDELIGSKVADHAGVQNLKITTEYDFIDIIIRVATGGIIYSRTITIEGEVYD